MKELMADVDVVYLEYDEAQFDQYERTLAYVWIDIDGTYVMVNEILLATDYAEPVYIKPNLRYADTFRTLRDIRLIWARQADPVGTDITSEKRFTS